MKKLYEVRQERTERVESAVKVWAESAREAKYLAYDDCNSPGGYMNDRTIEVIETKPAVVVEITDPETLTIWEDRK